ncbi:MAG: hypothetical protein KAU20_03950 [Nanoarchaeota archaeon]|nr:hypothetical protein [Nanoarchaeota archaeon]
MKKFISEKNIFICIGILLLIHWILLVIDRIIYNILPNLFWVSHLALIAAAVGFILRSNFLLSVSLILVLLIHGLWIYDYITLLITGNPPLNFVPYMVKLSIYRKILTTHHIYLIPLLFISLWKQKKISKYGWLFASALFAFSTFFSYFFLPRDYNINCAHFICPIIVDMLPFLGFLTSLHPIAYLFSLNIITDIVIFLSLNIIIYYIFKLYWIKHRVVKK